ncbi:hypothetical protein NDU88_005038 [Pleurodeles waltl]|uniref:Uncharacterized protein n=1 Tax=Pleurodeles waltl TaxID=8319 RepID=A0AAV7QDQ0_PLEWA|nr:hypothetical protein NDU88_005038 [Pleurodeles waltl]
MRVGEGPQAAGARTPDTAGPVSSLQPPAAPLFHPPLTVSQPAASLFTFLLFLQAYFVSAWPHHAETAPEVGIRSLGSLSHPQFCDRLLVMSPRPIMSYFYLMAGPVGSTPFQRPPS